MGSTPHSQTSTFLSCSDEGKVEAFIVDHVHLIVHEGLCNADMDGICIFVGEGSVMFTWWRLLIEYMCKIYAKKNLILGRWKSMSCFGIDMWVNSSFSNFNFPSLLR